MFGNYTHIKRVKNHSGEGATLRCLQKGTGYQIAAGQSLSVDLTIPWLYQPADANAQNPPFLRVDLQSGRFALIFQHGDHVYTGISFSQSGIASPHAAVNGDRDLVIGKTGLHIYPAGQSPNLVEGKPAGMHGFASASDMAGFAATNPGTPVEPAGEGTPDMAGLPVTDDFGGIVPLAPYEEVYQQSDISAARHPKGTIICLHGFDPFMTAEPRQKFGQFISAIRQHWEPRGYAVFAPIYPSMLAFPACADLMCQALVREGWPIHRTHFIGYSMGGLVCRRMVEAAVSEPASLTTICSPHHGTARWVPASLYTPGAQSLAYMSIDRAWLNDSARLDQRMRPRYQSIGVAYQDATTGGWHHNDQLIELVSQRGDGLGFGKSHSLAFYERRGVAFGAVHAESQHWPMAGHIINHVHHHIAEADARDNIL